MALKQIKEEWRSALRIFGVQFVMMAGGIEKLKLFVDNLATDLMVSEFTIDCQYFQCEE